GYRRWGRISLRPGASIPEVEALRRNASRLREEAGERIRIKVCVTGPYTLATSFERREPILFIQLGEALAKVLSRSIFKKRDAEVSLVAVDEPVFGLLSDHLLDFGSEGREALLRAWEEVCHAAAVRGAQTIFHLHSTSDPLFWSVEDLDVVESHVEDPLYTSEGTKRRLEEEDKFLKASLCLTDFDRLIIQDLQRKGIRAEKIQEELAKVWKVIRRGEVDPATFLEDEELMRRRLAEIVKRFGPERVPYAGAECGLKSFPSYRCALECLSRVSGAIRDYCKSV
ncbi:hypothetical protein CW700_07650, partial [Candidatus Bathyarchaeota archaeon]